MIIYRESDGHLHLPIEANTWNISNSVNVRRPNQVPVNIKLNARWLFFANISFTLEHARRMINNYNDNYDWSLATVRIQLDKSNFNDNWKR